jgi:guanine deaminase
MGPKSAEPLLLDLKATLEEIEQDVLSFHRPKEAGGRIQAAMIPRFALSFDAEALRALGDLYATLSTKGVYFSTHLSENNRPKDGEVDLVKRTFGVQRYLDVYDGLLDASARPTAKGFLGRRSVFAHAVHCDDQELARLATSQSGVSHCPTSQLFLGSGTMPIDRLRRAGVSLSVGSDVGAGDTFSIPEVLNACFKVHRSAPDPTVLGGAELLFLGTLGGARVLDLQDCVGNFAAGKDATFLVVNPAKDPLLAERLRILGESRAPLTSRVFTLLVHLRPELIESRVLMGH